MRPKIHNRISKSRLQKMIEEAVIDCYTDDEQHVAFLTLLEEHIPRPVPAWVIGEEVLVLGFELEGLFGGILAKCRRGSRIYHMNVGALEWPGQPPKGSEWIAAYQAWCKGGG